MKLLLGFAPFHPPTSPPYGLACLEGALAEACPEAEVRLVDFNIAFFRRWLLGDPPHLCDLHPRHLLGQVCPNLLVEDGQGRWLWESLTTLPTEPAHTDAYMEAAVLFDGLYGVLREYLGTCLGPWVERRCELDARLVDGLFGPELSQIQEAAPDALGLSVLAEQNLLYSLALGRAAKERLGIPVLLGGALMSHLDAAELLTAFPWVDFVFRGEAERSLADFVALWLGGARIGDEAAWRTVAGLAFRAGDGEPAPCGPPEPPDFASLPFADFGDFQLADYLTPAPVLPIATCRGCYWGKCTFCSHTLPFAPGVRLRSAERVVAEMQAHAHRHGVRHFLFVDEAMAPRTLRAVTDELLERDLDLRWGAEGIRVERQLDREQLERAHRAGLRWIYVGIEAWTQRLLDLIDKGIDRATVERLIADCASVGIVPQLSFIVGLPTTEPEELEDEIAFLLEHPVDFSPFVLLEGSPMTRNPEDCGLRVEDRQVLFESPDGAVHGPRLHFTVERGISPTTAERRVREALAGRRRARRPHLGEVHAIVLCDTGFFEDEARPPAPARPAERALQRLRGRVGDPRWTLHIVANLEALGDLDSALEFVEERMTVAAGARSDRRLLLHRVALLIELGRPDRVLGLVKREALEDVRVGAALSAELLRTESALGSPTRVLELAAAVRRGGFVAPWFHPAVARAFEELGDPESALAGYREAELLDWLDASHSFAQARCLAALGREDEAKQQDEKAHRKERLLVG